MTDALVQFVDSIAASPTVRLNLNSPPWRTLAATNLGFPELRYAAASTLLGDGEQITAAALGNRVLELRLQVNAVTADEAATQLQTLVRELNRPRNILKILLAGGTTPVFMRTYRSSPADWDIHTDGSFITIAANVPAEPTGYGLLETPVSGATLNTDPALSNGAFVDASSIKGDVETPAMIRWPNTHIAVGRQSVFAVRRRGTPSAAPFLFQAESQTNGTDTSDQANASFSGGSGTRTTFATATMQTRSTISDLGAASVDLRGRYRVFARYAKTVSGDSINMQIQWGTSGGTVTTNDSFAAPTGTGIYMADLGLIQVPRGWDPGTNLLDGAEVAASDTFHLAFRAERTAGSGNLDVDYFILVPADDRLGVVEWVEAGPDRWWLNAADNTAHARNSSDQIATAASPGIAGGLPMLAPNTTNRIYMVYEVASGLATTLTSVTVTVSYYPRYLLGGLRPVST